MFRKTLSYSIGWNQTSCRLSLGFLLIWLNRAVVVSFAYKNYRNNIVQMGYLQLRNSFNIKFCIQSQFEQAIHFKNNLINFQQYQQCNQMLKFLDNRTHEKEKKSPIKFKPQMIYGISAEAPQSFQTPYTIVHQQTYVNPFLQFQHKREFRLSKQKAPLIKPLWTKKTNLQMIEEQKIISSNIEDPNNLPLSRYRNSYNLQFNQSQSRFKITRGEFTDFIQKNNRYKSMGPIHGKQRTSDRIQNTKRTVWLKPDATCSSGISKILYSTYFDMMRQTSLKQGSLLRNQSSMSNNSKLISQKSRIRDNRQKMNISFQKNLNDRKHSIPFKYQLPKLQSQILGSYQPQKIKPSSFQDKKNGDIEDIQEFEAKLRKKFR